MRRQKGDLLAGGAALLLLSACGGGGGGGGVVSTPPPVSAPAPAPSPAPAAAAPPATNFATSEYQRSTGLVQANAIGAYRAGATGAGVTVGVIDSGIDVDSPEFAGRISPASDDLVSTRGLQDESGHGTAVSSVILAAKNDSGTHGVAFGSTLLVLRTDSVGSCTVAGEDGGCKHGDQTMARAIDRAVANNAKVINISLGGSSGGSAFRSAVARAAAAGLVIVISAGNDGAATPDPLATVAGDPNARGQVIITGAVDSGAGIASFSNRAGGLAQHYLVALGVGVRANDHTGAAFLYDGTSFAAPHVAGAVALLAQAFPNLSGRQLVELLYASATDLGGTGVDEVYGRGLLNIGRAFQPIGAMQLAGSAIAVSDADNGAMSAPMGDAGGRAIGAVILDGFDRPFAIELAGTIANARPQAVLAGALAPGHRALAASGGAATIALSLRETPAGIAIDPLTLRPDDATRARATAAMVSGRVGARTQVALGIAHGGDVVAGALNRGAGPAFLIAGDSVRAPGFDRLPGAAIAIRHDIGGTALWTSAEQGEALSAAASAQAAVRGRYETSGYSMVTGGIERRIGAATLGASAGVLDEEATVLGARFGPIFGVSGARTLFADAEAHIAVADGWTLSAGMRRGWTRVGAGGARPDAAVITSDAWRIDLAGAGLFDGSDRVGIRLSQPLRVRSGSFGLLLPVGYDVASGGVTHALSAYGLAPVGRELDLEAAYGLAIGGGRIDASLFWRRDPGNIAAMPDDRGGAIRFSRAF